MDDEYEVPDEVKIPGFNIADIDLSDIAEQAPEVAAEITRIGELMHFGDETPEEFRLMCQLLFDYGGISDAEQLLRNNLEEGDETHALYLRLFGREKEEEFAKAIEDFQTAFKAKLRHKETSGFLNTAYELEPLPVEEAYHPLFAEESVEVWFTYSEIDAVTAHVENMELGGYVILQWVSGTWSVTEVSGDE
jgi:hypothetical protein